MLYLEIFWFFKGLDQGCQTYAPRAKTGPLRG